MSGFEAVIGQKEPVAAKLVIIYEAMTAIEAAVPHAAPEDVRAFLDSEYGGKMAQEVLDGRSVASQLEFRLKRFLRHFEEVKRRHGR